MSGPVSLLPYQRRVVEDPSRLIVIPKSRRAGLSWALAYDHVLHAATGRGDVRYQSYNLLNTQTFIKDSAQWAELIQGVAVAIDETEEVFKDGPDGKEKAVKIFRIDFASGKTVQSMVSSPRTWRSTGRPGDRAIVDEAAFCDDLDEVLKAVLATLLWGGRVTICSSHNGEANPFNSLVEDIKAGIRPGSLHTIPFKLAIAEGLYKRICAINGWIWSPEAERAWEAEIRAFYGSGAREELDCIPAPGGGSWLSWEDIHAAETDPAELLSDGPAPRSTVYVGIDVARRHDLWVAAVVERDVHGDLRVREIQAERDISFGEQYARVAEIDRRWKPTRIAVDQTGMGEAVVEQLQKNHGRLRVEGWLMSGPRRLDAATALKEVVEDRRIRIPRDEALRLDLHSIKRAPGTSEAPRLVADQRATDGHADRFWALALAVATARSVGGPIDVRVAGRSIATQIFPDAGSAGLPPLPGQPAGIGRNGDPDLGAPATTWGFN